MSTNLAAKLTEFRAGITAIDADYVRPKLAASHLVVDAGRAAFVDNGTTHSVPNLLATWRLAACPDPDPADSRPGPAAVAPAVPAARE